MKKLISVMCLAVLVPALCSAQGLFKPGKIGIYGSAAFQEVTDSTVSLWPLISAGMSIHLTDTFALRPGITGWFSENRTQNVLAAGSMYKSDDRLALGAGVDALFFFGLNGLSALYISPGLWYTFDLQSAYFSGGSRYTSNQYQHLTLPVKFGMQYMFAVNIGLFIEVGAEAKVYFGNFQQWDAAGTKVAETFNIFYSVNLRMPTLGIVYYF